MITQRGVNFKFQGNLMVNRFRQLLEKCVQKGHSPHKVALTFCLGIYIGLSPFIGLRIVLTFLCGWLFALDLGILCATSLLVHNPWTIAPLYTLNHIIGTQLFGFFNIDGLQLDPSWAEACSIFVQQYTGIAGLSLSAFLVGGHLLGMSISVMLYPFVKQFISLYISKKIPVHESHSAQ